MDCIGTRKKSEILESFILDVSEGIMVGGIAGLILGLLIGMLLWSLIWQMLPTVYALPAIFFAGKLGCVDGLLLGGFVAFVWRLKLLICENARLL